jgi:hypothetical protein
MQHPVPPKILYSAYWYCSGTNQTMRDHLKGIADEAAVMIDIKDARVLDIGCNDGTLLRNYPAAFIKFGIDPSDVAQEIKGDITVVQDIVPSEQLNKAAGGAKVRHHHIDRHVLRSGESRRIRDEHQGFAGRRRHLDLRDVLYADDAQNELV